MEPAHIYQKLLHTNQVEVKNIQIENHLVVVFVESNQEKVACPNCGHESNRIHSYYLRSPRDLAWAHLPVMLCLKVKRFFCHNDQCSKRTFAERFSFVNWYARRTQRVVEKQGLISINVCARTTEMLLSMAEIGISDTTVNRNLRKLPDPEMQPVRVLGVDDWAKRKGQRYGTILVDHEKACVVDVLEDRTAETLAKWLRMHPEIEIVTRDRSKTYSEAIQQGAPQARQVADRWHLLKNASEVVYKIFQQERKPIEKQLNGVAEPKICPPLSTVEQPAAIENNCTQAEQHRNERIIQAQELVRNGWTRKAAARQLNIHPRTIRRYLDSPSPSGSGSRRRSILDPFKTFIVKRWNDGCHNASQIFREIQTQGYSGQETIVIDFARELRRASGIPPKIRKQAGEILPANVAQERPSLRTLTWWVLRPKDKRKANEEQILESISNSHPNLKTVIELVREYATLVRGQGADMLSLWIGSAKQSHYSLLRNFAEGLQQDEDAIRAALSCSWSNGRTEGNVNRLKYIKRLMYGRSTDDLLRKRVLWQGRTHFT
ncbi:MAG: ISL3 family transposase [Anaerolineales bacterium]